MRASGTGRSRAWLIAMAIAMVSTVAGNTQAQEDRVEAECRNLLHRSVFNCGCTAEFLEDHLGSEQADIVLRLWTYGENGGGQHDEIVVGQRDAVVRIGRIRMRERPDLVERDGARGIDADGEHQVAADRRAAFDHAAFEVRDIDEIILGGKFMKSRGWKANTPVGRHILGSNLFWYFNNPCGGRTEYFADMDLMDDDWKPRVWEQHPGFAMWLLEKADAPEMAFG